MNLHDVLAQTRTAHLHNRDPKKESEPSDTFKGTDGSDYARVHPSSLQDEPRGEKHVTPKQRQRRPRRPFTNLVGKEVFCGYVMVVTYKDKRPALRKKFTGYLHMTDSRLNDVLRKIDGFNPEEIQSVTLTVRVDNPQRPIDEEFN